MAKKWNNSTINYNLTPSALSDLRGIARQTIKRWDQKQADIYAGKLAQCFEDIAQGNRFPRSFLKYLPQVKQVKCEQHYVFYIQAQKEKPTIIAVLYQHMDMLAKLASRI